MRESRWLVLILALVLAGGLGGCVSEVTTSSRTYLAPERSSALSDHPPTQTALELTRLFEVRGFELVDQHKTPGSGEIALKFAKAIRPLAFKADHTVGSVLGSVAYVWVAPSGSGSALRVVGKPTLDGQEPCSKDTPELACSSLTVPNAYLDDMSGHGEAIVIHGVLSELELEGYVSPSAAAAASLAPASFAPDSATTAACRAQRHQAFQQAAQISDPAAREMLLKSVPECS